MLSVECRNAGEVRSEICLLNKTKRFFVVRLLVLSEFLVFRAGPEGPELEG